jgi:hypothetical protein
MLDYKSPNIASGATPIGSAERAPDRDEDYSLLKMRKNKDFDYVVDELKRDYSHRERILWLNKPEYF